VRSDRIEIRDLLIRGIVGIHEWERRRKQDIVFDVTLFLDLSKAGASDRLEDSVDYSGVARSIVEHVESAERFTLEALATDVVNLCLGHGGVTRVRVRVRKPKAETYARYVAVELERGADEVA